MRILRALPVLVLLAALAAFAREPGALAGFPLDDAWIFRVYARALAHGEGFAYDGARQEAGATSPLWVVASAPAERLAPLGSGAVVLGVKAIGALLALAAVLAAFAIAQSVSGSARVAALAASLFALEPRVVFSALSGMENALLVALWTGALAAWLARRHALALGLWALLPVTRPEALVLLPIALLVWLDWVRRAGFRPARLAWLAVALLPAIAWSLFCLHATGHALPNTFYLKAQPFRLGASELAVAWRAVGHHGLAPAWLGLAAAVAFAAWPWRARPPRAWTASLLLGPVAYLLAVAGSRHVAFSGYYWTRWLDPAGVLAMLPACIVVASGVVALVERARGARSGARAPAGEQAGGATLRLALPLAGLAALGALASVPHSVEAWRVRRFHLGSDSRAIDALNVAAGRWIAAHTPEHAVVAVNDAGAIRYFGARRTLDLVRLNDADVAFGRISREAALLSADWLAIFPGIFGPTPLAAPIALRFAPRTSFQVSVEEYTVCPCPEQTELRIYERNTDR
ncbi:MAG: hypothetical protein WEF50_12770 [Myxococcota bacterium]